MAKSLITAVFDLAHEFVKFRAGQSYTGDMSSLQAENELSAPTTYCVGGPPVTPKVLSDQSYYTAQANYIAARDTGRSPGDEMLDYFNCE